MAIDKNFGGRLAFEHFKEDAPQKLWRVSYLQKWGKEGKRIARCHDYFDNEIDAWVFAGNHTERGNEVISVTQFEAKGVCNG